MGRHQRQPGDQGKQPDARAMFDLFGNAGELPDPDQPEPAADHPDQGEDQPEPGPAQSGASPAVSQQAPEGPDWPATAGPFGPVEWPAEDDWLAAGPPRARLHDRHGEATPVHPAGPVPPAPARSGQPLPSGPEPQPRPAGRAEPAGLAETAGVRRHASDLLLPARRPVSGPGWRRAVYQASGGLLRLPASPSERRRQELISRIRTPVAAGHYRIAVMSLKGGVGKTTVTVGLGATLAALRGDRIIAVDANPDRGTLSDKLVVQTPATVRDLLNERGQIARYADVRAFTSQMTSRLEILASDSDPGISVAFSDQDYCDAAAVLERYYSVCLTDCGTGLLHSAMAGVLRLTDQVILVTTASVDGARSASATLDWLAAHGYQDLVSDAVVVLSAVRSRGRGSVDIDLLEEHFAARCKAFARVPYDPHLAEGAEVELGQLRKPTADAFLALAAAVADDFASPPRGP